MIKKIFKYFLAVLRRYTMGRDLPVKEVAHRLDMCEVCEHKKRKYKNGKLIGDVCNRCGCNILEKAKWSTEKCPVGKWEPDYILNRKKRCNQ